MKKPNTTVRKEALAAAAALMKILNEADEAEAQAADAKRLLEATQSELAAAAARLETVQADIVAAESEHAKFKTAATKEQAKANVRIDSLQEELRTTEATLSARRQELNSVLQGMAALGQRLKAAG